MKELLKKNKKAIIGYFITTIICIIINFIYGKFGHGVSSNYMTYMFLYPLILGVILTCMNIKQNKIIEDLNICGIATLTLGSFINGIFAIAGTASDFQPIFYWVGWAFIVIEIIYLMKNVLVEKHEV